MIGIIGWLKRRKERKIQEEEKRDKKLREFAASLPDKWWEGITAAKIDLSAITVEKICNKHSRREK